MTKIINKNYRYINITILILSLFIIFFSRKVINNIYNKNGLSLFTYTRFLFGYPGLLIGIISLIISIYFLIKNPKNIKIINIRNSLFIICIFLLGMYILEYIILTIINSFVYTSTLSRIPNKSEFLNSITFIIINYFDNFIKGVSITVLLSLTGTIFGLILGLLLVILRTQKINKNDSELFAFIKKVGIGFSKLYINVFRGTPMMVQAIIIYYLFPVLLSSWFNVPQTQIEKIMTITISGIIIVSLNTTAYITEVLRGGIEALDKGQLEAARSLGMTYWQSMYNVILPQAIKNSLPSIGNEFIINIKDTSVLNVIGVAELFFVAQDVRYQYYRTYEPFVIAALVYLFMTLSISRILFYIDKKLKVEAKPLPSSN